MPMLMLMLFLAKEREVNFGVETHGRVSVEHRAGHLPVFSGLGQGFWT